MMLCDLTRIKFRVGHTGYRKLIFNWFYDWHDQWNKHDIDWRNRELAAIIEKGEEIGGKGIETKGMIKFG